MKLNLLFLSIGLALSVASKGLQFQKSKMGNLVVIPAAVFLILAVLFYCCWVHTTNLAGCCLCRLPWEQAC